MADSGSDKGLGAVLRLLRSRGFVALPPKGLTRRFEGPLSCQAGPVRIRLEINDWDFVRYPTIRLLDVPAGWPALVPHVSAVGGLCYYTAGAVVLDRYHPDHAIAQCLEQARRELDRLSATPAYRQDEFQTEFGANWNIGQLPLPWTVLLASIEPLARQASAFLVGPEDARYFAVTSQEAEVAGLCRVRGWPAPKPAAASCWVIRSEHYPTLATGGLPRTVAEMFVWIKSWDRTAYAAMQTVLGQKAYLAQPRVLFLVHSPAGWFGFEFMLNENKRLAFRRKPALLRQSLHGRDGNLPVSRMAVSEIGSDYVHSRNLSFPTLKDRQIKLVGCGAIGGYLAQALVKLGAGSGTGQLVLIDPDNLRGDNLGRHLLGFESLFMAKAEALRDTLTAQFPAANVIAQARGVQLPGDLIGDLIIDATGEEALSEALNYHRLQLPMTMRPSMLHVWVTGNGECTQGLWVDSAKFACFRCLRCNDPARSSRYEVLSAPADTRILGCQAFTPYAVSAPMAAAALAIDLTIDWLKGNPSPRFRTRSVEGAQVRKIKNQNLAPLTGCPACLHP